MKYPDTPHRVPKDIMRVIKGQPKKELLSALFELSRMCDHLSDGARIKITGPKEAYDQVRELARWKTEVLVGLYLDSQNGLLGKEVISQGSLNTTRTHPREILIHGIRHQALGFILAHNHPSGTLVPSSDDVEFTRAIGRAGELVGIPIYDHLIVSINGFVSLKEKGLL